MRRKFASSTSSRPRSDGCPSPSSRASPRLPSRHLDRYLIACVNLNILTGMRYDFVMLDVSGVTLPPPPPHRPSPLLSFLTSTPPTPLNGDTCVRPCEPWSAVAS